MTAAEHLRRTYPDGFTLATRVAADGWPLRAFDWQGEGRGSILWLGGRGEFFEKYLEAFRHWHASGWGVHGFDWRGQGGSGRLLADPSVGHVGDFEVWIGDLADYWRDWTSRTPGPHILMAHSMGGHLALRALAQGAVDPDALVLSAPMLGLDTPRALRPIAYPVATVLGRVLHARRAWKTNEKPGADRIPRQSLLTRDPARYADELWWAATKPELALGPPSWGWVAAAYRSVALLDGSLAVERIATPTLLIGTEGDALVSPAAIRRYATRLPKAEMLMFGHDVAHEVLREVDDVRDAILARIDRFVEAVVSAP